MSKLFVDRIIIKNRAPFENLDLTFRENEIAVLTAVNGRGKTTLLSYIVDAWYEIVRPHYPQEFEGKEDKYYRISSQLFCIDNSKPSFVYIRFKTPSEYIDYVDIRSDCTQDEYNEAINISDKIRFQDIKSILEINGNIKFADQVDLNQSPLTHKKLDRKYINNILNDNVVTYFPSYRYEIPGYLNDPYKIHIDFSKNVNYSGYLKNPLEVVSGLPQLANWILDVVLDMQLYQQTHVIELSDGQSQIVDLSPERTVLWQNLN